MSFGNIRQKTQEPVEQSNSSCHASNCPCRGTISFDGGRWMCYAHAFATPQDWPRITERLHEFGWLIQFTDDIKRMNESTINGQRDWREFAEKFWGGQDEQCMPHASEEATKYINRMKGELLWRCGLSKRPAVRIPEPPKKRFGNVGRLVA